ncbi:MAG TPA: hypothetical protein VN980_18600, partial [Alphaproteobacteria bacterium]|nr:hypothetical protein [Alphaproteobacteria bacterium]
MPRHADLSSTAPGMSARALAGREEPALRAEHEDASARPGEGSVAWRISRQAVGYEEAVAAMEARVAAIRAGTAAELVWLLEHPPLVTAGTSAKPEDLLERGRFPVYKSGRGGQFTYHGPGQRVAYVMLDLRRRGGDVRRYVHDLEEWIIRTLAR